ncbi:hypothetical protein [uncultured Oscillibacter sp.]|jgi:hypothetical protein|uniref:hypothetical protein n=1 Tax=uncultured Oscillibacter sp. TaxID=876091 RepID=UPI00266EE9C6|nr:hypothetical protein [uncultured Oscillibacter sp.]
MATKETKQAAGTKAAPQYTAAELANAAQKVFGVPQDVATAALRMAGVKAATIEEAKKIVQDFAKKEVK